MATGYNASTGVIETAQLVQKRAVSAREVVEAALKTIDTLQPVLHPFLSVDRKGAIDQADIVDTRVVSGDDMPLAGVVLGIKDLLDIEGEVTGAGMTFLTNKATADSTVVARLRAAGAIIIGKLVTTEGANVSHNPALPQPVNPWGAEWWTGISSSGSGVAAAARLCHATIGTDTGGSIRMPSAANGLTGIKPTWGRVSRAGLFPVADSFDHIGPMARDAGDCAAILQVIAGHDPRDLTSSLKPVGDYLAESATDMRGLVIGVDPRVIEEDVAPEVGRAVRQSLDVLTHAGAQIREITFPDPDLRAFQIGAELAVAHADLYPRNADAYGEHLRGTIEAGLKARGIDVVEGAALRRHFEGQLMALLQDVDLIATPVFPWGTPRKNEIDAAVHDIMAFHRIAVRFMLPFNLVGLPTTVFPVSSASGSPPISAQFAARPWRESDALRAAHAFQRVTNFHQMVPPLAD